LEIVKGVYDRKAQMAMYSAIRLENPALGLLWLVGCSTGYRVSDLLSLRVFCIDSGLVVARESKTGKIRRVELPKSIYEAVNDHTGHYRLTGDAFLFCGRDPLKPISRQHAHRVFKKVGLNLGLADIGTHSMRKTFAYNVLVATRSFEFVKESLNHSYLSTTFLYLIDGLTAMLPKPNRYGIPPATVF